MSTEVRPSWAPGSLVRGGGIYSGGAATVINNTICGNKAELTDGEGGGISAANSTMVANTVLWGNAADFGLQIYGSPTVTYCDVQGGWTGTGNISTDPLFVDPAGTDFHLTFPSPCKDSGNNAIQHVPTEDYEGDPRPAYGTVDMGADEFDTHLYFTGEATHGGDVALKFVGLPGTTQVGLIIGFNVFDPPLPGAYGPWYMKPPMIIIPGLGPIPAGGVYVLQGTLPPPPMKPYTVHFQGMIGWQLTNLSTMYVE